MTIQYRITNDAEFSGAVVYIDGEPRTIAKDHPKWTEITGLLLSGLGSEDELLDLISPITKIDNSLRKLGERVAVRGNAIYFDGDLIDNALTKTILRVIEDGSEAYKAYVAFMEKLATNPSKKSRKHFFAYISANDITIADDGDVLLYKGVTNEGFSTHAGYGIVNGTIFENAQIPNAVGDVVEIPRDMVDDNREQYCSTGLHAGNYNYASTFAQKLLTVKINPRDVVSVPSDVNSAKVRVCRYVVQENNQGEYTSTHIKVKDASEVKAKKAAKAEKKSRLAAGVVSDSAGVLIPSDKVKAFEQVIPDLVKNGVKLSTYKNKRVTAGRRADFAQAAKNLGYEA